MNANPESASHKVEIRGDWRVDQGESKGREWRKRETHCDRVEAKTVKGRERCPSVPEFRRETASSY